MAVTAIAVYILAHSDPGLLHVGSYIASVGQAHMLHANSR